MADTQRSVKLRIVADAGTARTTLDDIASKADSIDGKHSSINVGVNSGTTKAQLDEISAKAEALGITNVRFTVKADTSQANKNLDETEAKTGGLKRGFLDAGLSLSGFGDAVTVASGESSMFARVLGGLNLATGVLEPVLAGAVVTVGALGAGMVSAGLGAGIFGRVATAAVSQVSDAVKAYAAVQSSTGAQQVAAQQKLQQALAQLTPAQRGLAKSIAGVQTEWQKFIQGATPGVAKVLSSGIKLLPGIFKDMGLFLGPVETALGHVVDMLGKGLNSAGTQGFIKELAANSGPALEKLAIAIGHIVQGLMGILHAFMPMSQGMLSGVDNLTAKFAKWGETLTQHTGFQSLMTTFKTETPLAINVLKNLAAIILNVGSAITGLSGVGNSKALLQFLGPLSSILASLSKNQDLDRLVLYLLAAASAGKKLGNVFTGLSNGASTIKNLSSGVSNFSKGFNDAEVAASDASGVMGTFGGKLSTAVAGIKSWGIWSKAASAATKVWTGIQVAFDAVMDANPIALVVIGIAALIAIIVVIATKTRWFQDIWDATWGFAKKAFDKVFGWIKSHWPLIFNILIGPIGLAAKFIVSHWSEIVSGAKSMVGSLVGFFTGLPGRIVGALSGLASSMFNIGSNIIWGVIRGVESAVGGLFSYIGNIGKSISSVFSSVLSIFSPSRVFMSHGANIVKGLVLGIQDNAGQATGAVADLGRAVSGSLNVSTAAGRAGVGRGNGGNTYNFTVTVSGLVGDAGATGRQIVQAANEYLRQTGQGQLAGA